MTAAAASISQGTADAAAITDVASVTDQLAELHFPIGWTDAKVNDPLWWLAHVLGWLITAGLIMLGAPFWFDLLGKLVPLRSSGQAPAKAADDKTSATGQLLDPHYRALSVAAGVFAERTAAPQVPGNGLVATTAVITGASTGGLTSAAETLLGRGQPASGQ